MRLTVTGHAVAQMDPQKRKQTWRAPPEAQVTGSRPASASSAPGAGVAVAVFAHLAEQHRGCGRPEAGAAAEDAGVGMSVKQTCWAGVHIYRFGM